LLENKAEVNARLTNTGATALYAAAKNGHLEVVKLLVDHKADVNASCTDDGTTPLHAAAQTGRLDVVKLLLANKADKNARSHNDVTPFDVAQRNHHLDVIQSSFQSS